MRKLSEKELWERVRQLECKTVYTLVRKNPNHITRVTDDAITIEGRRSKPTRESIVTAYEHLWKEGKLQLREGGWGEPDFMYSVVPAILERAIPEQVEVIPRRPGEPSGIRLKR